MTSFVSHFYKECRILSELHFFNITRVLFRSPFQPSTSVAAAPTFAQPHPISTSPVNHTHTPCNACLFNVVDVLFQSHLLFSNLVRSQPHFSTSSVINHTSQPRPFSTALLNLVRSQPHALSRPLAGSTRTYPPLTLRTPCRSWTSPSAGRSPAQRSSRRR
jgi:hypothetical protein